MPQGRVKFVITTAPRRPVRKPPQLMLAAPPPTIAALEREIAEVEERLLVLRAKLSSLTAQQHPKRRVRRGENDRECETSPRQS
jgi:hypothetical protein